MPSRMLHESILVSPTIASLSRDAEVLFYRLLVKCDDFGRFHGMPEIIQGQCYSLQLGEVTRQHVIGWLAELSRANLIQLYAADGRQYLQVVTWRKYQRCRAEASKFPDPPTFDGNCQQMTPDAPVNVNVNVNEDVNEDDKRETAGANSLSDLTYEPEPDWLDVAEQIPTPLPVKQKRGKHDDLATISDVYDYFKCKIQPGSKICPVEKIRARLKKFPSDELKLGIDHFAADWWQMENNAHQGADWYFATDARVEKYLNLKPRKERDNGHGQGTGGKADDFGRATASDVAALAKYR